MWGEFMSGVYVLHTPAKRLSGKQGTTFLYSLRGRTRAGEATGAYVSP